MSTLEFALKNCWEVYSSGRQRKEMDVLSKEYLTFLTRCKTERETVARVRELAEKAGFAEGIAPDGAMFVLRGKTIVLARPGKKPLGQGFRLLGAHGDTPHLDLKQRPLLENGFVAQAKTHYYGGILKHQWLARPLALHGVVALKNGRVIPVCLGEDPAEPVFAIADLLPHLAQKQMEKKVSEAFEAEKLNILFGHAPAKIKKRVDSKNGDKEPVKRMVLELLHDRFGLEEEDLYSAELHAVPAGPARPVGLDGALLGGYGQDDRICVFSGLQAFLAETKPNHTQLLVIWDKEEIGSEGSTGAKSRFFEYCLQDLVDAWDPRARLSAVFYASKAVSGDVHAAMDPDFQDLHDKLNAAQLGHGPCFCKFTGHRGKVGANDAHAEYVAWFRALLENAGVPWQMAELGKVDLGGGGTVAKHLAEYGLDIIDFGPALLSMHSPWEISSKADLYATVKAYQAFFRS
ncbi:MAG TPA: aminopeptidase [Desulfonatronum sp.]|nr:aminopeptidase [Desulfonatronum sp.]